MTGSLDLSRGAKPRRTHSAIKWTYEFTGAGFFNRRSTTSFWIRSFSCLRLCSAVIGFTFGAFGSFGARRWRGRTTSGEARSQAFFWGA